MPELPEVEVLVRHLAPLLKGETVREVSVRRSKVIAPTSVGELTAALKGKTFTNVSRRGKYLLFTLADGRGRESFTLLGHLGMTGRMYLQPKKAALAKHAAVTLDLGGRLFVYEDTRYFGRFTPDLRGVASLGPEPLGSSFTVGYLLNELKRTKQPIKVKLLDQTLVAGVGNIYASEALHRASISPRLAANRLTHEQAARLWRAIRKVLREAIRWGSTVPLDFSGMAGRDGLFYYGGAETNGGFYQERLLVYDRAGKPCGRCGSKVRRLVQAARSTFYCAGCQKG